jgi:hypothetical protein
MSQADTNTSTTELDRPRTTIEEVYHGLSELESPVLRLRNLAYAARMLASSDEMPKEPGAALDSLADTLVNELDALSEERGRLWHLSHEACHPPKSTKAGGV